MVVKLPATCPCIETGVPYGRWSNVPCCPNCGSEFRITVAPCCGKTPPSPSALSRPLFIQQLYPAATGPQTPASLQNLYHELSKKRLADTLSALRLSGWYYSNLDWQGARTLLKEAAPGAFIIRNSGDSNFIFSLSVQTERGPTSVRLHYELGCFRLDCDESLARYMPRFQCVVELAQHYASAAGGAGAGGARGGTVWVDRDGCPHSPVLLSHPMRQSPATLAHASRLAIHKALDSNITPKLRSAPKHRLLPLPSRLLDYLGEYPYWI